MPDSPGADPRAGYDERHRLHSGLHDAAARRSLRLSNVRGITFLAVVGALVGFEELPFPAAWLALGVAAAVTATFVGQVVVHRRVRGAERWQGALAAIAREGLLRLDRDWAALDEALPPSEAAAEESTPEHPYARDLGVTGRASLFRLAGPVTSERGRAILRAWLLEAVPAAVATARQGAVRELSRLTDFRADFAARGRLDGPETLVGLDPFLAWAEQPDDEAPWRALRAAAWVLPPVTLLTVIGYFGFAWPPWWIVPALAQVEVLRRHRRRLARTLADSVAGGPPLRALAPQMAMASERAWDDPHLAGVAARFGSGEVAAHRDLQRLSRLLDTVESRRNAFYGMLAPVLLLDVHLCWALERWRFAHGMAVRDWLEALGEFEALSGLATIAHDHPDWVYPTLEAEGPTELRAAGLGHPLLPPKACVRNDVRVGPPESFLLVTGSNMSGKSTLLRAIGANAVLAGAGAPVCARALALPPLRVHTCMRVEDSLEEGISLFMAELLRIKTVVEAADRARERGERVLYLLDEILHGTNTAERQIAARGVMRHLLASGAIGAISTHDLTLAESPELASAAHAVHFREEVVGGDGSTPSARLTFDYLLREGVATTRNALELLRAVGLGELTPDPS